MDSEFEKRYRRAVANARQSDRQEPRAKKASYDAKNKRVVIELTNGTTFIFPPALAEGLSDASASELSGIEITQSGDGLRWYDLDVDFSLTGLLTGIFGGRRWMSELGRKGGKSSTAAKASAARENGRKGGRPRRKVA